MTGAQCVALAVDLYDVAGGIRATLQQLQRETRVIEGSAAPKKD